MLLNIIEIKLIDKDLADIFDIFWHVYSHVNMNFVY